MAIFHLLWVRTGHYEAVYEVEADTAEVAERILEERHMELEPIFVNLLRDENEEGFVRP